MSHWIPNQPSEDALPPDQIRILDLRAEPWPNQDRRIRIYLDITPFQQRPNIEVSIFDSEGTPLSNIHIIETIETIMTFTMHLKSEPSQGPFSLIACLSYPDSGVVDEKRVAFDILDLDS